MDLGFFLDGSWIWFVSNAMQEESIHVLSKYGKTSHITYIFAIIYKWSRQKLKSPIPLETCLFTELADSKVWELPDGLLWHFLQKRSTSLAVLKKKFGSF